MKLTWQTNEMVSCLHAAEAWPRCPANMDAALAGALTASVTALLQTLLEQGVPPDDFWSHVVPLSARIQGAHQLTHVTVTKGIGNRAGSAAESPPPPPTDPDVPN